MKTLILLCTLALSACSHASTPANTTAQGPAQAGKAGCCDKESCPMTQDGVQVVYSETSDGAAMVFSADDVPALQARVAKMAEKHASKSEAGHHQQGGHPGAAGKQGGPRVEHSARADNTATGAQLIMTPADPAQLEALRSHVRDHVEMMQRGECPMMGHHG